jgi:hypothetical protein
MALSLSGEPTGTLALEPERKIEASPERLSVKASQYDIAMGDSSPGYGSILSQLQSGYEDQLKEYMARDKVNREQTARMQVANKLVSGRQGPLSEDETLLMMSLRDYEIGDERVKQLQDSIFESEYGRKFIEANVAVDENDTYEEAMQEDPSATHDIIDRAEWATQRNTIVQELLDDAEATKSKAGVWSRAEDLTETFIPGIDYLQMRNLVKEAPASSLLIGNNLEEQIIYLHSLPPDQFKAQLKAAYEDIKARNIYQAERFLNAVVGYGSDAKFLDNVFGIIDPVDTGVGALAVGGRALRGSKVARFATRLKGAAAASAMRVPTVKKIAQVTGNIRVAAQQAAVKAIQNKLAKQPIRDIEAVVDSVPSLTNPKGWTTAMPPNLSHEAQARVNARVERNAALAEEFLTDTDLVTRTARERMDHVAERVVDDMLDELNVRSKSILDVGANRAFLAGTKGPVNFKLNQAEDMITNTESVSILVGSGRGAPYATEVIAKREAAKLFPNQEHKIVSTPNGGYAIEITRDLPETLDNFKGLAIPTGGQYNASFLNGLTGMLRTPKDTLPLNNTVARQTVAHGSQNLYDLYREIGQPLADLSKEEYADLERILKNNRDFVDPVTGDRGMFYKNQFEFEDAFNQTFNKLPNEKQVAAYYSYVQLNELDLMVRWTGWYRDKVRMGLRQFSLDYNYTQTVPQGKGKKALSKSVTMPIKFEGRDATKNFIDGVLLNKNLPDVSIAIHDSKQGGLVIVRKGQFTKQAEIDNLRDLIDNKGFKVLQHANGNFKIPNKADEYNVGFLVTDGSKEERVALKSTENRGGGHIINAFDHYLKQPIIAKSASGRHYMTGDVVIAGARTEKDSKRIAALWDEARIMMNKNDPNLGAFTQKHLGMPEKEFARHFKARKNKKGETIPGLDPNVKIVGVRKGMRSSDVHHYDNDFPNFMDTTRSPYNLYHEMDKSFAGERGSSNMMVYLEEDNPLIRETEGELLDPLDTLRVSARNMFDIRMKRDYVLQSAQEWIENFADDLDIPKEELYRNPVKYLYNPEFKKGADPVRVRVAKNGRNQILRFLGHHGTEERTFEYIKTKTADIAYERFGKKGLDVAEDWVIPTLRDPAKAMRSVAFNAKLGLFNPAVFLTNIQTMANTIAISPRAAVKGFPGGMAARFAAIPSLAPGMKKIAVSFGWEPAHWDEMMDGLTKRSGWDKIGGSVAQLDDIGPGKIFDNGVGKFLDAGRVFFDQSEKIVRTVGYSTAYQEWRMANPHAAFDRRAREIVRNRADTMTVDMSNANNASWQKGVLAVPAQFLAYQVRFTEQMIGKRLTWGEKARIFAMHSALYGMPVATGGALGVWPFGESIRNMLTEEGIPYDDNSMEVILRGIPAVMLESIGYNIDVGARFGTGGISLIRDLWRGDKTFAESAMGASGSMFTDMFATLVTGGRAFLAGVDDDPNNPIVPMDGATMMQLLKNITSVNNSYRFIYAMNTGKWISKKGVVIDEVSGGEALGNVLTGATLEREANMYAQMEVMKDWKAAKQNAIDMARQSYRRADLEDDPMEMKRLLQEAKAWAIAGGLNAGEWARIRKEAIRSHNETQLESIMKRYERLQEQGNR